jgi:hypothetical protein
LEGAKGAATKVQVRAYAIALLEAACSTVAYCYSTAVVAEGPIVSTHEPAIGAVETAVPSCGIKVGPAAAANAGV